MLPLRPQRQLQGGGGILRTLCSTGMVGSGSCRRSDLPGRVDRLLKHPWPFHRPVAWCRSCHFGSLPRLGMDPMAYPGRSRGIDPSTTSLDRLGRESGKMRIAISSIGRFHMFDLARQLARLGQEVALYTGYPKQKVDPDLRPVAKTRPFWVVAEYLRRKLLPAPRTTWWADRALEDFGPWLAREIGEADILDALAGTGLETGRILREKGVPWICNRGSTHILAQKRLLEEEHSRWNAPPPYFSPEGLDRALTEYDEADAIVVPSEFARRSFLEQGTSPERIFKCSYGVDLSLFSPILRPKGTVGFASSSSADVPSAKESDTSCKVSNLWLPKRSRKHG